MINHLDPQKPRFLFRLIIFSLIILVGKVDFSNHFSGKSFSGGGYHFPIIFVGAVFFRDWQSYFSSSFSKMPPREMRQDVIVCRTEWITQQKSQFMVVASVVRRRQRFHSVGCAFPSPNPAGSRQNVMGGLLRALVPVSPCMEKGWYGPDRFRERYP